MDSIINNISKIPKVSNEVKRVDNMLKKFGINYLYKELKKTDEEYSKNFHPTIRKE